jgi:hypothetical protein
VLDWLVEKYTCLNLGFHISNYLEVSYRPIYGLGRSKYMGLATLHNFWEQFWLYEKVNLRQHGGSIVKYCQVGDK